MKENNKKSNAFKFTDKSNCNCCINSDNECNDSDDLLLKLKLLSLLDKNDLSNIPDDIKKEMMFFLDRTIPKSTKINKNTKSKKK